MAFSQDNILQALAHCAQEPFHTPGAIQPHGALLVFDVRTLRVTQTSANVETFVGLPTETVLGGPVTAWMASADVEHLECMLSSLSNEEFDLLTLGACSEQLLASLHLDGDIALLELEWAVRRGFVAGDIA